MSTPSFGTLKYSLDSLQQKARERTVKTQNVEYDLETLIKRIGNKTIKLDPDYQRRHRWSPETSSRLIESVILNIPIPVIFISQDVDVDEEAAGNPRYTVIDGQQRLTAIFDFMKNELPLSELETLSELNGAYYKDLPPFLIRRLEERTIKCLRIDSTVDPQVKFDIFERLNTGSIKLESQELRNVTARGPFNDALKMMAKGENFRKLIQVTEKYPEDNTKVKKMEDVELALRFFALKIEGHDKIKKGFKEFLTASLNEFNKFSDSEIMSLTEQFEGYMNFLLEALGPQAFSKWRVESSSLKKMSNFNAAVYDAIAVGLASTVSIDELAKNRDSLTKSLKAAREELFRDAKFFEAVSGSVNDAAKVATRIKMFAERLAS
ncbi:hypothetical protein A6V36_05520 [Paraburkholderia ginsengiterrae]|uniref:GmrSD restriction endonucleases N-terminal domain-containing protein n=1 Tax=Paraburkholderia ginsengiterrae TaxID=1462993 RepID=A0A1A9NGA8_9BURK|nr:DUF262 domain-containing protein [Paraburkholderia ginsengiterrae]OAJ58383.1 hypothetical protein A6V36_05520 [Paraburkholderia ginsengiterrae]OAJ65603.1 hypothetical protein A6V37_13540 [Paraburkholderia ginsengiterrae]